MALGRVGQSRPGDWLGRGSVISDDRAKPHWRTSRRLYAALTRLHLAPWNSFDAVYARGCSNYHYDLMSDQAMTTTRHLLTYLKPGGVFIMVIVTNLSGSQEPGRIWHNTLDDYRRHFSSFGTKHSVDWIEGMAVCGLRRM